MTDPEAGHESEAEDPILAGMAEQATRRLQSGDPVDVDDYVGRYPARAGSIRRLLSVLDDLTALGRSMARRRPPTATRTAADDDPGTPMTSRRLPPPEHSER
jgi:hypothetical protein